MGNLEYIRRIDQFTTPADKLIAADDGFLDINKKIFKKIANEAVCTGTYSYTVPRLNGENTKVALEFINKSIL